MPPAPEHPGLAFDEPAKVFAALGDETRVSLIARLSRGEPLSIKRLSEGRGVSRQSISKHLRILTSAGLVRSVRHGRERRFALEPQSLDLARESLDRISRQWDAALERLKQAAESGPDTPPNAR